MSTHAPNATLERVGQAYLRGLLGRWALGLLRGIEFNEKRLAQSRRDYEQHLALIAALPRIPPEREGDLGKLLTSLQGGALFPGSEREPPHSEQIAAFIATLPEATASGPDTGGAGSAPLPGSPPFSPPATSPPQSA